MSDIEEQWDLYLKHYGVKGMRWGIRKERETSSSSVIVVNKGSSVFHVTANQKLQLKKRHPLYISFTEKDRALYKGSYAQDLMFRESTNKVMDYELKAVKDLIAPSRKKAVDEFLKLHTNDSDILQTMAGDKIKASFFLSVAKYFGMDSTNRNFKKYKKALDSGDQKKQEEAFEDFAAFLAFSEKSRRKYFSILEKQGFNSMFDYNDMRKGFADKPLIIFDSEKTLKIKGSKGIEQEDSQKFLRDYKEITGHDLGILK